MCDISQKSFLVKNHFKWLVLQLVSWPQKTDNLRATLICNVNLVTIVCVTWLESNLNQPEENQSKIKAPRSKNPSTYNDSAVLNNVKKDNNKIQYLSLELSKLLKTGYKYAQVCPCVMSSSKYNTATKERFKEQCGDASAFSLSKDVMQRSQGKYNIFR